MTFSSRFPNLKVVDEPVYKSELVAGLGYMSAFYSQTSNSTTITNSTTETTIIGNGIGELSVPANTFLKGNAYIAKIGGIISSENGDLISFKVKANGGTVILADTGNITLKASTNKVWQLEIQFVIREIGTTGVASIKTHFVFSYEEDSSNKFDSQAFDVLNTTTFNTTILNTLDITTQWGQAKSADSIYSTVMNLNKIF